MTRLPTIPTHLTAGPPPPEPDPTRTALLWELRALRSALSLCAGRMAPTRESILAEVERVERLVERARELAGRL